MISPFSPHPPPLQKSTLLMRQKLALESLSGEDHSSHVFWLYWQIVYSLSEGKTTPKQQRTKVK